MGDIAINVTNTVINNGLVANKPPYLISLDQKTRYCYFLTIDAPEYHDSCIKVKGIFLDSQQTFGLDPEEVAQKCLKEFLTAIKKEDILEVVLPLNVVNFLRNLIFKTK